MTVRPLSGLALFFGLRAPGPAPIEIGRAGALFLPYLAWVTFAVALNAAFVRLNY